jgi:hypothetical protein
MVEIESRNTSETKSIKEDTKAMRTEINTATTLIKAEMKTQKD